MVYAIIHWSHKVNVNADTKRYIYQSYDYSARAFDTTLILVDPEDTAPNGPLKTKTIDKAIELANKKAGIELKRIYISVSNDAIDMKGLAHPKNALYIIGEDYGGFNVPTGELIATINVPKKEIELWSHVVLGIVLYDRLFKRITWQ